MADQETVGEQEQEQEHKQEQKKRPGPQQNQKLRDKLKRIEAKDFAAPDIDKLNDDLHLLIRFVTDAPATINRLRGELKDVEDQQQDILHLVEEENMNVAEGFMIARKLKEIRLRRRAIKVVIEAMEYLLQNLTFDQRDKLKGGAVAAVRRIKSYRAYVSIPGEKKNPPKVIDAKIG